MAAVRDAVASAPDPARPLPEAAYARGLTLRALAVHAVEVPLARPLVTASGTIRTAPLALVELFTGQGVTGCAYVFAYQPAALLPLARLIENVGQALGSHDLAPLPLDAALQQRFRLLGQRSAGSPDGCGRQRSRMRAACRCRAISFRRSAPICWRCRRAATGSSSSTSRDRC